MSDKLKFYNIKNEYIEYLRKIDKTVLFNKQEKRPYIGIVLEIGENNYYVPLASPKEKHKTMKNGKDFSKIASGSLGAINFNNMIPVPNEALLIKDIDNEPNEQYKNLLQKQYVEILNTQENIRKKAQELHNLSLLPDKGLSENDIKVKNRCCNFALLEEKCKEYEKMLNEKDKTADKDVNIKNSNKDANKDKSVDNNSDKEYNISSNNEEKNNENNSKSPLPENKASKEELEDKQFFDTANMINNTYGNIKTVAEKANIALNNIKNNPPEHTENHKGNNITNNLSTSEDDKYDEPT